MSNYEISLWDLVSIVRRHFLLFIFGFLIVFALVIVATIFLPRKYRSEAQLQLKLGWENLSLDSATSLSDQAAISMAISPDQEINTIANVLQSRNLAANVVRELGPATIFSDEEDEPGLLDQLFNSQPRVAEGLSPYHQLSEFDQAVWTLQDKIKIRPVKESNTIKIHYDCKDPKVSQTIVNCFVEEYLKEHRRIHEPKGSEKFLIAVVEKNRQALEEKRAELESMREDMMLVAVPEQRKALVERISNVQQGLTVATAEQKSMQAEIASLKFQLNDLSSTTTTAKTEGSASKAASEMRTKLFDLEMKEKELLEQFDEDHHRVRRIQNQIAGVKQVLAREEKNRVDVTEGPSLSYEETNRLFIERKAGLEGIDKKIIQLKQSLGQLNEELKRLNINEIKIDRLETDIAVAKKNYERYQLEAEQARVDEALADTEISNVRVVPASLDPFPVFPVIPLNLAIGFVLAIFSGLGLAFLGELRKKQLHVARAAVNHAEEPRIQTNGAGVVAGQNGAPASTQNPVETESTSGSTSEREVLPRAPLPR